MAVLTKKPIASWWHEIDSSPLSKADAKAFELLDDILIKLGSCVKIFHDNKIFSPSKLKISKRWLRASDGNFEGFDRENLLIDVAELGIEQILSKVLELVSKAREIDFFCVPAAIEFHGKLDSLTFENLATTIPDQIVLEGVYAGIRVINIRVHSDELLPYSLDGKRKNKRYVEYAGYLEDALKEVEDTLGVGPIYDDFTDFCKINGYRLENVVDENGEPIPIDEFGNVLPSNCEIPKN